MIKILILATIAVLFSTSTAFGQLSTGTPPDEDIKVTINENGNAHVVHEVKGNPAQSVQVIMISGNITNFSVTDQANKSVQYSTFGQKPMSILLIPTQRNMTYINYDLVNALSQVNGVWKWDYYAPSDAGFTDFYFPKGTDMIWVNDRAVYLGDKGLRQHGNGMHLAYIINEPEVIQTVQWQDKTFDVGIRTLANPSAYVFDQSSKAFAFNVDQPSHVIIIMPKALLWGPYDVKLNSNSTFHTTFHDNGTHAWIGLDPGTSGTIQVTGTTAIPEFPLFVPLAIAISSVVAIRFMSKLKFY